MGQITTVRSGIFCLADSSVFTAIYRDRHRTKMCRLSSKPLSKIITAVVSVMSTSTTFLSVLLSIFVCILTQQLILMHKAQPFSMDNNFSITKHTIFESTRINVIRGRGHNGGTIPINTNLITSITRYVVPRFDIVNFEFSELSQSAAFQNGHFSRKEYHAFIQRASASSQGYDQVTVNNEEPILKLIIREFGDRNGMKLKVRDTQIFTAEMGTGIHFDALQIMTVRWWIPLTSTIIDNLCLGVADISDIQYRQCAIPYFKDTAVCSGTSHFDHVTWYQQSSMTNED